MADTKIMFAINGTDYSHRVVGTGYAVQKNDEYNVWTDANGKEHRSAYRTRIEGKFTMLFLDVSEYNTFEGVLLLNKNADLTYPITVYDNKTATSVNITAFIDFTPSRYRMPNWTDNMEQIEVTIREQ